MYIKVNYLCIKNRAHSDLFSGMNSKYFCFWPREPLSNKSVKRGEHKHFEVSRTEACLRHAE